MTESLDALLGTYRPRFELKLGELLQARREQAETLAAQQGLFDALEYSALDGGKRLRAMLVYLCAHCMGDRSEASLAAADCAAAAIELLHCYSLVHDDLPAMDDDDMRRGKPSCHVRFGEATAILAGDALQALAFEVLADNTSQQPVRLREQLAMLGRAAGALGMVGGQAVDLAATGASLTLDALCSMHRLKTGALIECAVGLGALCADADRDTRDTLQRYAGALGLAFQVRDDVLDVNGSPAMTGKARGADAARGKPTFTSVMGLAEAEAYANATVSAAVDALAALGERAGPLAELARYVAKRES
ncbi:MAG: polyprenyl synthetase family protein [Pseudomonadales bacterium]